MTSQPKNLYDLKVLSVLYNRGKFHLLSVRGTHFSEGGALKAPPMALTVKNAPWRIGLNCSTFGALQGRWCGQYDVITCSNLKIDVTIVFTILKLV